MLTLAAAVICLIFWPVTLLVLAIIYWPITLILLLVVGAFTVVAEAI